MTDAAAVTRKLDLGRVFKDTGGVVQRQAPLLFGLTFVLYLLPTVVTGLFAQSLLKTTASDDATAALAIFSSPIYWTLLLVGMLLGTLVYGCVIWISLGDLEGRAVTPQEALQVGLKRCLPLLAASLLFGMGVGLGMVLLLVPGIILAVMWAVLIPVLVENRGVFAAFGRSRALTRGNRWRIFGLFLIAVIAAGFVQAVLTGLVGGDATVEKVNGPSVMLSVAVLGLYGWLIMVLFTVGLAALYVQLRELKGGGGESVAQVFS